jgi:O-antigen ligase
VGPEQIPRQFLNYLPEGAPRPWPEHWYAGHLHNVYVQYAAERGLPALAVFLWLIGKVLVDFTGALRRQPPAESRFLLLAAMAIMIGVLVGGMAEHTLGDSEVLTLFVAAIAIGYVALDSPVVHSRVGELHPDAQHAA